MTKHLNNKGYMLVEIIVASVIAFSIAYYLLNLVYKFKDINEDVYVSTTFQNDKTLIVKNIMDDIGNDEITKYTINNETNTVDLTIKKYGIEEQRRIKIENRTIEYGIWDDASNSFDKDNNIYYKKELNKSLEIGTITIEASTDRINLKIKIPVSSIYNDKKYNINLYLKSIKMGGIRISDVSLGSYVSYTPSKTSATAFKNLTGYSSDQTFNPSELNLWRVIKKNDDGTVEIISEHVSSTAIHIFGKTGYINYVKCLDTLAKEYINSNYAESARHFGSNGQTQEIPDTNFTNTAPWTCSTGESCNPSEELGGGDLLYLQDYNLVKEKIGTTVATKPQQSTSAAYWTASRHYDYSSSFYYWTGTCIGGRDGNFSSADDYMYDGSFDSSSNSYSLRPIITLKSDLTYFGSGSATAPYTLIN